MTMSTSSISAAPVSPVPTATWKTPVGEAALAQAALEQQRRQRRHLGWLDDDGVARGERWDGVTDAS